MFYKKCFKCKSQIKKNYDYCPCCGVSLKSKFDEQDYGLLGKNDSIGSSEPDFFEEFNLNGMPFGRLLRGAIKEIPSVLKMLEKQFEDSMKEKNKKNQYSESLNVQFFVNGKRITPFNEQIKEVKNLDKVKKPISKEQIKMFSNLPKVEPESEVRRLSGKIVYNIYVPGVKNVEDVFINQLENSIEIKALGEDKVYSKTLKLNLPIRGYELIKENLVLELSEK